MTVIQGPHLSEKAHFLAEQNQIVFKVRRDATKSEIKKAGVTLRGDSRKGHGHELQGQAKASRPGSWTSRKLEKGIRQAGRGFKH